MQFGRLRSGKSPEASCPTGSTTLAFPAANSTGPLQGATRLSYGSKASGWSTVEDDHLLVTVLAVDKREDGVVYESAIARLLLRPQYSPKAAGQAQEVAGTFISCFPRPETTECSGLTPTSNHSHRRIHAFR